MSLSLAYFPDEATVRAAMNRNDPLLVLVSFDRTELIVAGVDDAVEHAVLLGKVGQRETEIDSFFRIVLNRSGADWTFVCPVTYRDMADRERRIARFYADGIEAIREGMNSLGYEGPIDIPTRYQRHLKAIGDA